ncbi:MAG: P-loop NTPase family protein [Planctomycetota bacterium]|jgi:adenylate kinase family enzyme
MDLHRVAVIGTSCSGKTVFAARLAGVLGYPHVELDAIHWGPGWTEPTTEAFRAAVAEAVAGDRWVVDGNYGRVRDLVWPRAGTIFWLNFGFPLVFRRALLRTIRRVARRERLFGGNVETFRTAFLDRDGIPWWVIRTYGRRRRAYRKLLGADENRHLEVVEFRQPYEADAFFRSLVASPRPG